MNAKELREAAESALRYDDCDDSAIDSTASHILATVRPDDDEPVNAAWSQDVLGAVSVEVGRNLFLNKWAQVEYGSDNESDGVFNTTVKTRGEFRQLCRLLGVELKEGE